ncbi:hypothetical protein Btru_024242 [Bulinus truncatus]|nr:hypothetical protein Btru_024242 [Bulinus truncatus]
MEKSCEQESQKIISHSGEWICLNSVTALPLPYFTGLVNKTGMPAKRHEELDKNRYTVFLMNKWNTSVIFLALTQCFFIGYTLYFEQYMRRKPFNRREGLGFFWLMRVLMYLPFLHSLPVYYAATTEVFLPKPLLLLNSVIYLFGIIVYISSSQQKENFAEDNLKYKNLRSVAAYGGKRFLISGYWGMVQKPDYIGYMIIWFSWTVACGFSYLSLIVLTIIYGSVFSWTQQATRLKQHTLGNSSWVKYEQAVPNKLIPYLY